MVWSAWDGGVIVGAGVSVELAISVLGCVVSAWREGAVYRYAEGVFSSGSVVSVVVVWYSVVTVGPV